MLNMFGLKMKGLKRIAGESKTLDGYLFPAYLQISYDMNTGEVMSDFHCSLGGNSWTEYADNDVITVCNLYHPTSMQDLALRIQTCVEEHRLYQTQKVKCNGN